MRIHIDPRLVVAMLLGGCAHAPPVETGPQIDAPALVLDGTVLSCRVYGPAVPDTGCAALAFLTVRHVAVLNATDGVRYFGPVARHGAYVAQTDALDMTPLPADGRVVPATIVVGGVISSCLTHHGPASERPVISSTPGGFACPAFERLTPDRVAEVEIVKPPRSIELFGRGGAAGVIVVTLKP